MNHLPIPEIPEVKNPCFYCLERQLEPQESIGLFRDLPICEECLNPMIVNRPSLVELDKTTDISERIAGSLESLENFVEGWQIRKDETLQVHQDFYNHKAIAVVGMDLASLENRIDKWKSLFYGIRAHTERLQDLIESIKAKQRAELRSQDILHELKNPRVKKETQSPTSIAEAKIKKLAKALGISEETLRENMRAAKAGEIKEQELEIQRKENQPKSSSVKNVLSELKVSISEQPKRCNLCGKINCSHGKK